MRLELGLDLTTIPILGTGVGGYPQAPRAADARLSVKGDSFGQEFLDSFQRVTNYANFIALWRAIDGQRPIRVNNVAVGGKRTDEVIAEQVATVSADPSKWVLNAITGVNDIGAAATGYDCVAGPHAGQHVDLTNVGQVLFDNLRYLALADIAAGKTPIMMNCAGVVGWSADQISARNFSNDLLAPFVLATNSVLIDLFAAMTDGVRSTVAFLAGVSPDGTHFTTYVGSLRVAKLLRDSTGLANMPSRNVLPLSNNAGTSLSGTSVAEALGAQILKNNHNIASGTVSTPTGFSGTGPTGFVFSRAGGTSSSEVESIAAAPVGNYSSKAAAFNGVTSPSQTRQQQDRTIFTTDLVAGDRIAAVCRVDIPAGSVQFHYPSLSFIQVIDGVTTFYSDGGAAAVNTLVSGAGFWPDENLTLTMMTPTSDALASGAYTSSAWAMRINGATGSATVKLSQEGLIKLT